MGVGDAMIDIHSHLIPRIDDGARSVDQTLSVLRQFAADGVHDVVLTPHLRASELNIDPEDALERRTAFYEPLRARAPDVPRLHLGFEIMLDQPLPRAATDRRFSLAGSRFYLVEFPPTVVGRFAANALEQIAEFDVVPIVAHPERYHACSVPTIAAWRDVGALIQVDATTLTRNSIRGRHARQIVAAGFADVVAADNHGDRRSMKTAVTFLEERGYADAARQLTARNAKEILEDGKPMRCRPIALKEGVWSRIKGYMGY